MEEGAEVVVILLLLSLARDIFKFFFNTQHFTGHLLKFRSAAYLSSASSVFMGTVVNTYDIFLCNDVKHSTIDGSDSQV